MIEDYVYRPHNKLYAKRDMTRCAFRVYDKWRTDVIGHQCTRQIKCEVGGVGFCMQHGVKIFLRHSGAGVKMVSKT